jgi:predicted DCC family thiol-disulfide oxidoreductase YuxK
MSAAPLAADSRPAGEPRIGWVLYDGNCGVCSRWVQSWSPLLARRGLAVAPLQSPWVETRTGLAAGELVQEIRLLETDGRLHSGPDVYRQLMRRIWWTYPFYLLSRVPVVRRGFDWAYRTFARHRMHISASCGIPGAP